MIVVVRVRIRVEADGGITETAALACSGYEAETPQLMVPAKFMEEFGYQLPKHAVKVEFDTAGGPLTMRAVPSGCKVQAVAESPIVKADLVISPIVDEVLLNDKLIGELQLSLEDMGKGLWRFSWEPKEKLRKSLPLKRYGTSKQENKA